MSKDPDNQSSEFPRPPKPKKIQASAALEGLFANRPKPPALDQNPASEGLSTANQNVETQEEKRARILKDAGVDQRPNPFADGNSFAAAKLNKNGAPLGQKPVDLKTKAPQVDIKESSFFQRKEKERLDQEAAEAVESAKKAAEPIVQSSVKEDIAPKPTATKSIPPQSFISVKKEEKAQIDPEKAAAAQAKWAAKMAKKSDISLKDQLQQRLSPKSNTEHLKTTPQQPILKLDLSKSVELLSVIGKPRIPPKEQTKQDGAEQKRLSSKRNSKDGPFMR